MELTSFAPDDFKEHLLVIDNKAKFKSARLKCELGFTTTTQHYVITGNDGVGKSDAVQEIYLRLWERRKELSRCINPQAYSMQMLKNHCITLQRQKTTTVPIEKIEDLADDETARQEALLLEERASKLDNMMERLPEVQRRAVQMRYIDCIDHEEMQRRLGLSSSNVYTTLSRAIANLKTMMNYGK